VPGGRRWNVTMAPSVREKRQYDKKGQKPAEKQNQREREKSGKEASNKTEARRAFLFPTLSPYTSFLYIQFQIE
jgi:hypothetical protein